MSDTPKTDKWFWDNNKVGLAFGGAIEFCRSLERELAWATSEKEKLTAIVAEQSVRPEAARMAWRSIEEGYEGPTRALVAAPGSEVAFAHVHHGARYYHVYTLPPLIGQEPLPQRDEPSKEKS